MASGDLGVNPYEVVETWKVLAYHIYANVCNMQLPQYCIIAATHNYANLSHPVNQEFGSDAPCTVYSIP